MRSRDTSKIRLEAPKDQICIDGRTLEPLGVEHRPLVETAVRHSSYPSHSWYADFTYLWCRQASLPKERVFWLKDDGFLMLFALRKRENRLQLMVPPIGSGDPDRCVEALYTGMQLCRRYNGPRQHRPELRSIDALEYEFLARSPRFATVVVSKTAPGIEFHYGIERLCRLEGPGFQYVRRKLSRFKRNHPNYRVRAYRDSDHERLLDLYKLWLDEAKSKRYRLRKRSNQRFYRCLLDNLGKFDHAVRVVEIEGAIVGMVSGSIRPCGDAWCYQRLALHAYAGLSEFLVVELAKEIQRRDPTVEILNDGSDTNDDGLRFFKQRFRPVRQLKRYKLFLNSHHH